MRESFLFLFAFALMSTQTFALTPEQWKLDLSVLRKAIAAHPNPFHRTSRDEFERKADALAGELGELNDSQVVARLAELVALLGDGHTRLTMPVAANAQLFLGHRKTPPPKIQPFESLPIRLTRTADGLLVTQTTEEHADLLGALALAIHEKAIAQAEYAIRPLVYGDNAHQQDYLLPQFLAIPELLAAVKLTPEAGNVLWTFRLPDGKQVSRSLHPVDREPIKWSFLPKSSSQSEKRHWFTKSSDGLIYARLTDIQNDPKESVEQFAESVFAELAATPNSTLILDLRDNQGGDNTLNDAIVRAAIRSPKVWEPGRFFVLINGGTFSAASNLVTLLERWIPVIFVGQPTGGAPNEYGDPKRVVLPESGLSLLVSSLYWQVSSPTDQRDSTTPLLPVEPTAAALRNGRDDSVNLIRALLKEPVATNGNFAGRWAVPNQQLDISLQLTTDTARLTVHPLQIDAQPIANLKRKGATLEGDIALGNQNIAVHGRLTGSYLLGWLELSGRPYSFVARAQSNP